LYGEKLRTVREAFRAVQKSHLNHDPFLGCEGKDKKRHVQESKKTVHVSLHQVLISSSTMHFVLFHEYDNFSKKNEHQSNKCQPIFVHYLFMHTTFHASLVQPTLFFLYD